MIMFSCDCGQTVKSWIDPSKKHFCRFCITELKLITMIQKRLYSFFPEGSVEINENDVSRIRLFLSNRPGIFFKSTKLNDELKLNDKGSCPKIRKAITLLIFGGFPIISTGKGFAMPKDKDQIKEYVKSLKGRRDAIDKRIDALNKMAEDQVV